VEKEMKLEGEQDALNMLLFPKYSGYLFAHVMKNYHGG
jgi:hypothetical protein